MVRETIDWDKHDVVTCDDRGRATLGSEYSNERVFVYVVEMPDKDELGETVESDVSSVLTNMLQWADREGIDTMTHLLDPENGIVTDKNGNRHKSPYSVNNQGEYDGDSE